MNKETNFELLLQYIKGQCSSIEAKSIENWLKSNPDNHKILEVIKLIHKTPESRSDLIKDLDISDIWTNITKEIGVKTDKQIMEEYTEFFQPSKPAVS